MDEHDTKATITLIGELWPSTMSERWGWAKVAWQALANDIRRIPITGEQAKACLSQLWREDSDKPNSGKLLTRLRLLTQQAGGVSDRQGPDPEPLNGKTAPECLEAWAAGTSVLSDQHAYLLPAIREEVADAHREKRQPRTAGVLRRLAAARGPSPMSMTPAEMYGEKYLQRETRR